MNPLTTLRGMMGDRRAMALAELHRVERRLARQLLGLADRYVVDHEVRHVARDLADWSCRHLRHLADLGEHRGVRLDPSPPRRTPLLKAAQQRAAVGFRGFHEPAVLLLAELRHVHRTAAGVGLDWDVLAQTAQALEDEEMLAVAQECHPETLRQMHWADAKVKELAAQAMVTGVPAAESR